MKIRFTGLLLLISLFLLSACGQKGPLYLEKAPAPDVSAAIVEDGAATGKAVNADEVDGSEKKD